MIAFAFIGLLVLLFIGLPIFAALGGLSMVLMLEHGNPSVSIAQVSIDKLNGPTIVAVPFFVIAAQFMERGGIARALINRPKMLLCDEPTGNLDSATGAEVVDLLIGLHRRSGLGLLLITHQRGLADRADRLVVLEDGRIVSGAHAQKGPA